MTTILNKYIPNCILLDDTFEFQEGPSDLKIPLWNHQKTMLKKCLDIEEKNLKIELYPSNIELYSFRDKIKIKTSALGILNDPPGSGKTMVILSLIAIDIKPSINIIIIPENIHKQWIDTINNSFSMNTFNIISVKEYSDIYNTNNIILDKKNLIITNAILGDRLLLSKIENHREIRFIIDRIVIDEIDTVTKILYNIPDCKIVWFLSASFNAEKNNKIGPFNLEKLSKDEISSIICRCDHNFIKKSQNINSYESKLTIVKFKDGDISLFNDLIDRKNIILLNALNIEKVKHNILSYNHDVKIETLKELADTLLIEYKTSCERIIDDIEIKIKANVETNLEKEKLKLTKKKVEILENRLNNYKPCIDRNKIDYISEICVKNIKNVATKWIFFSDDYKIFYDLEKILNKYEIGYLYLVYGNLENTENALDKYKNDNDIKVLFINSIKDGCGLNLENTTDILFLHYTEPRLIEQVIGRAQRPGRTCDLNIYCLFHENEISWD